MAKGARVDLNSKGIGDLLKSPAVRDAMGREAARIAAAAGPGMAHRAYLGRDRMRATVWTETREAKRAEAENRALTRAAAARGSGQV